MNDKYIHILSLVLTAIGLMAAVFLYWSQPRTFAEISTKGQVAMGTYQINKADFDTGIANFRKDEFASARAAFQRADPERHDAATQSYIAYSYYREGWGRISNDDTLFRSGLEAVNRVIALDPNFRSSDESLKMRDPAELKSELEEGLKITPSDFNPMRLTRERK